MIVHSDSWTFFSSESQDPTGPDVGRSFMLKIKVIKYLIISSGVDPFIMFGRVIYICGAEPAPVWPTVFRMTNSGTFISNVRPGHLKDVTLTFVGL